MTTHRVASKQEWNAHAVVTLEDINVGSLQRIADATEKMAASYDQLRARLTAVFGSVRAAMIYAGVPPRSRHGKHEWRPGKTLAGPPRRPLYDPFLAPSPPSTK